MNQFIIKRKRTRVESIIIIKSSNEDDSWQEGDDHNDDSNSRQGNGDKNSKYNEDDMTNVSYESNDKTSHENNDKNEAITNNYDSNNKISHENKDRTTYQNDSNKEKVSNNGKGYQNKDMTNNYDSNDKTSHENKDRTTYKSDEDKVSNNGKGYKSIESNDDKQESGISMITRPSTAALVINCNTQGTVLTREMYKSTQQTIAIQLQNHKAFHQAHSKHLIYYDRNWETEFPWLEVVTDDEGICFVSYAEGIKQKKNTTTLKYGMKHLVSVCVRIAFVVISIQKCMLEQCNWKLSQAADKNGGIGQTFQAQISL